MNLAGILVTGFCQRVENRLVRSPRSLSPYLAQADMGKAVARTTNGGKQVMSVDE